MINFGVGVVAAGLAGVVLTRECIDLSPSGYINPILSWYVNKTLDHQEDRKGWNLRTPTPDEIQTRDEGSRRSSCVPASYVLWVPGSLPSNS